MDARCSTSCNLVKDEPSTMQFRDRGELLNAIKACRKGKDLWKARRIHGLVVDRNLISKDVHLATALIITYSQCGVMGKALEVFQQLPAHDVVAWNAMISGYAKNGLGEEALKCFRQMEGEGLTPNRVSYIFVLKACGMVGSLEMGAYIEKHVKEIGLLREDIVVGNALVDMYCKCGALVKAQEVFEQLPSRDVVSWSALIAGYIVNGRGHEALKCFRQMQDAGVLPDVVTYISALKGCGMIGCLEMGARIEADVRQQGGLLLEDIVLGTALMDMYAKCGVMEKAHKLFEQLPGRDVVTWNVMITGYVHNGRGDEALKFFEVMKRTGVCPNVVTYICSLKACGMVGCLDIGKDTDLEVRKQGLLQKDLALGNALVDMYAKCGALEKACETIQQLQAPNVVAWSSLISGYVQSGLNDEALKCFERMQETGIFPDIVTFVSILKACGAVGALEIGKQIDVTVRKQGLLQNDIMLGTALVDMYSRCGSMEMAQEVFEHLQVQDLVAWSTLIAGYARNSFGNEALKCFRKMQDAGIRPDVITYISILKACGSEGSLEIGENIDASARKEGLLEKDAILSTALVDMYMKCGAVKKAQEVFDKLEVPDVALWNTMITGYAKSGRGEEALKCFKKMRGSGFCPDSITYAAVLKACVVVGSLEIGESVEADLRKQGLLQRDAALGDALVDMYCKFHAMHKARTVFEELPMRNVGSWNAVMSGYVRAGLGDEALRCVRDMRDAGVAADAVTYVSILKACGMVGCLGIAEGIHAEAREKGLSGKDDVMSNALLDMYCKCGSLERAREVFENLAIRSVVSWTSLAAGYAQSGRAHAAFDLYRRMAMEGIGADSILYTVLLTACCHAGLVKEGEEVFRETSRVSGLRPTLEHYTCMLDLYGRTGRLAEAEAFVDKVPWRGHRPLFVSLLASCREWRNVELGRWAFEQSVQLGEECGAAYVCMGNIVAAA